MYIPIWSDALFHRAQRAKQEALQNNYLRQMESLDRKLADRKQDMGNSAGYMSIDTTSPAYQQRSNKMNAVASQTRNALGEDFNAGLGQLDREEDEWWFKQWSDTVEEIASFYKMGKK